MTANGNREWFIKVDGEIQAVSADLNGLMGWLEHADVCPCGNCAVSVGSFPAASEPTRQIRDGLLAQGEGPFWFPGRAS